MTMNDKEHQNARSVSTSIRPFVRPSVCQRSNNMFSCYMELIVRPRSSGYVYIRLYVNIEINTFVWHIQKSGVAILKYICCEHG